MFRIANSMLWVLDQDEALEFYTQKVGFEVRSDVTLAELGNFRWLTVGPPGQPEFSVQLMAIPQPPVMDADTAEQLRTVMAKGWAGSIFLVTDDVQSDYEQLRDRGVEFFEGPEERPYGIDCGVRDTSGNGIRLTQLSEVMQV
jgi:catechol 2,3-dioxygenase-like lactoylglutathione lyase family enzyme